ncbi:MAG TPA: helix-turn-helix domain-containing protein [Syntrophorhabdaceae bacterium]|nr:helix-turn-helix domain-containing protein [Syntrophorhabdaceae bacterium]
MDEKTCPVTTTLGIIGGRWTLLILRDLFSGTRRFGELRKSLSGISPRTLSARLKFLEQEGIVQRKVYAEVPPKVEYSLTTRGKTLGRIIEGLKDWGREHSGGKG